MSKATFDLVMFGHIRLIAAWRFWRVHGVCPQEMLDPCDVECPAAFGYGVVVHGRG